MKMKKKSTKHNNWGRQLVSGGPRGVIHRQNAARVIDSKESIDEDDRKTIPGVVAIFMVIGVFHP